GASRHLASRAARRGVVADRVAARRARADQILAFHHAQRHRLRSPRRFGEIALVDRARLPGTQAGARLWRLRRAWVARLSPPRHTLYRRLRLPDRRTRRPSPLRTALHPALLGICPSRRLPTPRRRRSAPNGMCRTRSQPSADVLSPPSPGPSRDALVAMRQSEKPAKFPITDAVRLGVQPNILHAPAVEQAVDHDRQSLELRLPAGRKAIVEKDRPRTILLQLPVDVPDKMLALSLIP